MPKALPDIDSNYSLEEDLVAKFRDQGFLKLKKVLSPEALQFYGQEITQKVVALNRERRPLEERDTYAKAFLQIMNLWRESEVIRRFVFSKRLAKIATELLGTRGVRLYHDQALYKEPGGGHTPWHVDQYYWPLSNSSTVTAWIPLQAVPTEMGPLELSVGSQKINFGREFKISDESEQRITRHLKLSHLPTEAGSYELGEVRFHSGFTLHRAGPNTTGKPRRAMTIIYMDSEMRLAEPINDNQKLDWKVWMPGAKIGEIIDTPLNPVLYQTGEKSAN